MSSKKTIDSKFEMNHVNSTTKNSYSPKLMRRSRILKNLIIVCLGFLFLFSAYQALANLQSTLNMEADIGIISQSVIYVALVISSLFLPKLLIKKIGCKLTLLFSILTYAPYVAANFHPHFATILPASVIIGLGAAPLWTAKCTYINELSAMYSSCTSESVDVVTSKFFGVFFMVFQNTQIWGNLASFFILKHSQNATSKIGNPPNLNFSDSKFSRVWFTDDEQSNITCGVRFSNSSSNENLEPPPKDQRYMLVGIYLACVLAAAVIVAIFLDPLERKEEKDDGVFSRIVATLKHLKKPQQLLLVPLTIFSGIEQAFILGDYTKAYVACEWGLHTVGLVFICFGIVNAIMSLLVGPVVKYVSRKSVMIVGAVGNLGVCIVLFLWEPGEDEFIYAFIIIGVWGLSDAIWQTQLNSFYGLLFRSEEEAGFANYRLWESFGFAIAFASNSFFNIAMKMYMLLGFLLVGIVGYMIVEFRTSRTKAYTISDYS